MSIIKNETKEDSLKQDEPECEVLKEFIAKYNQSLEENIKLKEEVFRLQKENVDLMDMLSYHRDQMDAHLPIKSSTPVQSLTLADELKIDIKCETTKCETIKCETTKYETTKCDIAKCENIPSIPAIEKENEKISWFDDISSLWSTSRKKRVYFVFLLCIALVVKGFTTFNLDLATLQTKMLPYYTIQEITTDIFNHIFLITPVT